MATCCSPKTKTRRRGGGEVDDERAASSWASVSFRPNGQCHSATVPPWSKIGVLSFIVKGKWNRLRTHQQPLTREGKHQDKSQLMKFYLSELINKPKENVGKKQSSDRNAPVRSVYIV